jgi:hypothetical protein
VADAVSSALKATIEGDSLTPFKDRRSINNNHTLI